MRASRNGLAVLLALAAALVPAASVRAADPRWFADETGGETVAKWGIAENDAVGFSVGCEEGFVVVSPELYALQEPSDTLTIRFSIDGKSYDRRATLTYDETISAWHAKARISDDDALITAMRRGKALTYDFDPPLRDGDSFTVSLSGSAKVIDEALEEC